MQFAEKIAGPRRGAAPVIAALATAWLPWVGIPGLLQGAWSIQLAAGVPTQLVVMQVSGFVIASADTMLQSIGPRGLGSQSMYFATGTGGDARLVSVAASSGRQTTIGRFAWPPGENLIDPFHGRTYTVDGDRISAYAFDADATVRPLIQTAADLQAGIESLERAAAFAERSQIDVAAGEAAHGIKVLETVTSREISPDDEVVARRTMGDWFALAVEMKIGDRAVTIERAISEYERALALLTTSGSRVQGWKQEIDRRLQALRAKSQPDSDGLTIGAILTSTSRASPPAG
jgi:hypothetical protein